MSDTTVTIVENPFTTTVQETAYVATVDSVENGLSVQEIVQSVECVQPETAVAVETVGIQGPSGMNGFMAQIFTVPSVLTVGSGAGRFYAPANMTISNVSAYVATAPTGASIIFDVNKNGTTIFTTQANRPTILAGQNTSLVNLPDEVFLSQGDYLSVDIDQIGSTVAGANATLQVEFEPV